MSLKPRPLEPCPKETAKVAHASFPKGNPYLTLHDEMGTIFEDEDFADLFPKRGQPALSPWRLALVTVLQFRENLPDRQAAEAVRGRIDWKYLLGLELTDPGFDFSVLSEFRDRLLQGGAEEILLDKLLERCHSLGLVKERGRQRTDSTHVLAAIRVLNRLELVGETLRAALNELAVEAPDWLRGMVPEEWYQRYGRRIEDDRLFQSKPKRDKLARTIGEDGYKLLESLAEPGAPEGLDKLPKVQILRRVWERHYQRDDNGVRFKTKRELSRASEAVESPYDDEARYRKRSGTIWTGYIVHVSETCDDDIPNLLTNTFSTTASVHEARCTEQIQQSLVDKGLPPDQHLVDSAYVDADLLVSSRQELGITLVGPTRPNPSWQAKVEGAYDRYQFEIDWEKKQVHCPQGKQTIAWRELTDRKTGEPYVQVVFSREDCLVCNARSLCTRSKGTERRLRFQSRVPFEALKEARQRHASKEGKRLYAKRAGVEGTVSQGVRAFGLRRTRYRGLAKTHLQHVATAAAINLDRIVNWIDHIPRGKTPTSRFAALALAP
jgi:transposase